VIRDRSLIHALIDSYGSRLMKGRFPVAVLFLRLPFDELDVNVHPTKHEVRFVHQNRIFTSVKSAVSDALIQAERKSVKSVSRFVEHRPAVSFRPALERDLFPRHSLPAIHNDNRIKEEPPVFHSSPSGVKDLPTIEPNMPEPLDRFTTDPSPPPNQGMEHGTQNQTFFSGLRIIGQLHNSYILCDSGEGLVIIDQHAAHERIVFEDLKKRSSGVRSQDLLLPETVELGYKEAEALETVIPSLTELGLEIEPFGGNCFAVKSVPAMLSTASVTRLIVEIAEKMVEVGSSKALEIALDDCLIVMSCHGAIRANQALSDVQIRHLLRQMDDCESPSFCPHGRPTWTRYSIKSIEKSFKR
jgi:DNA mismatch repair protein MutL